MQKHFNRDKNPSIHSPTSMEELCPPFQTHLHPSRVPEITFPSPHQGKQVNLYSSNQRYDEPDSMGSNFLLKLSIQI